MIGYFCPVLILSFALAHDGILCRCNLTWKPQVRVKMMYSTAKSAVLQTCESFGLNIAKKLEVRDLADLTEEEAFSGVSFACSQRAVHEHLNVFGSYLDMTMLLSGSFHLPCLILPWRANTIVYSQPTVVGLLACNTESVFYRTVDL